MAKVKKKTVIRKKIWLPLVATDFFNKAHLGEAYLYEPQEAVGKHVSANLAMLTRDPKKQNVNVTFLVTHIAENKGMTRLIKYLIIPSSMKRLVRRNKSKVTDSFVAISANGEKLRVKPVLTTRSQGNKSVETALRMGMRAYIIKLLRKTKTDDFFTMIVLSKLQKEASLILKKIFPLAICEIRCLEILKDDEGTVITPAPAEPAEKTEEETPEQINA